MKPRPRAVLVGIQTDDRTPEDLAASLKELGRLCHTLGLDVVGEITQRRSGTGSATVLGEGKLVELAAWTGGTGVIERGPRKKRRKDDDEEEDEALSVPPVERRADMVVVDCELSPSQLRNLQSAAGVETLDRTGVILEIFHRNAHSREARLQVELARLAYVAPRLRETGGPSERRSGKGAGESDLELDRRKIRDRMAMLRRELADIDEERGGRRDRRKAQRQVALVGYTNAGKSSLMRELSVSEPFVADQLFATLDTTVRALHPPLVPRVLVVDTVGFIRDLPHDLVASFRSTLDAALDATVILQVVDASDPDFRRQLAVTSEVLSSIGGDDVPRILVLNKCDKVDDEEALAREFPDAVRTSAKQPERVAELHAAIAAFFAAELVETELFVPWSRASAVGQVHANTEVLAETYEDDGVRYRLRGSDAAIGRLRGLVAG